MSCRSIIFGPGLVCQAGWFWGAGEPSGEAVGSRLRRAHYLWRYRLCPVQRFNVWILCVDLGFLNTCGQVQWALEDLWKVWDVSFAPCAKRQGHTRIGWWMDSLVLLTLSPFLTFRNLPHRFSLSTFSINNRQMALFKYCCLTCQWHISAFCPVKQFVQDMIEKWSSCMHDHDTRCRAMEKERCHRR
jgi:hypothetical protein